MNTQRRDFLKSITNLSLGAAVSASIGAKKVLGAKKRYNVIFMYTDDQRPDTIHALGNPNIITPNLDKMVENGTSFNNMYLMGANTPALCLPSRHMLITGDHWMKLPKKTKEGKKTIYHTAGNLTMPQVFNKAGYYTGAILKKGPSPKSLENEYKFVYTINDANDRLGGFNGKEPVDNAISFLDKYQTTPEKKDGNPFFLYLCFTGPHDERFIDKKYLDMYKEKPPVPKNFKRFYPYSNGFGHFGRDDCMVGHPRTEEMIRTELHYYYGMITSIDEHIGRLMDKVKEMGEYENTIFVFASDHGLALGSHGLVGKQNLYDCSLKGPLVVMGPGIQKNKRNDALMYIHDLYPTCCELSGISVPDGIHASSVASIARGEKDSHRDSLFLPLFNKYRGFRKDNWKLLKFLQIERPQLFDVSKDPDEMNDLAGDPEYTDIVKQLENELFEQMKLHKDKAKIPSSYKYKILEPITEEEVVAMRSKLPPGKDIPKQRKATEEARKKAGH